MLFIEKSTEEKCKEMIKYHKKSLKIVHQNIREINDNIKYLQQNMLSNINFIQHYDSYAQLLTIFQDQQFMLSQYIHDLKKYKQNIDQFKTCINEMYINFIENKV